MAQDGGDVAGGMRVPVIGVGFRNVGRRIAARVERDAAIALREPAHLAVPTSVVVGKFVNEDYRMARSRLLKIELRSCRLRIGHIGGSSRSACVNRTAHFVRGPRAAASVRSSQYST